jgi:hypothetical protein
MNLTPNRLHYSAVAVLAAAMMAVQIVLSRIFSVIFYYHYAFAGVTIVMLGLTLGALRVYTRPDRFLSERLNAECAYHVLRAGLLLAASVLLLVDIPGWLIGLVGGYDNSERISNGLIVLSFCAGIFACVKAFIDIGVAVTLLLTYFPAFTSKLYAVDLASAALGCILVIVGLRYLDPIGIIFLLAMSLGFLAWRFRKASREVRGANVTRAVALVLAVLCAVQVFSYMSGSPAFRVRIGKLVALESLLFERWNTYSHVAVFPEPIKKPEGWGFGSELNSENYPDVEQYKLAIDASASTVLTKFDGDFSKVAYLKYDVINLGYHLRPINHSAIIGVGGGRDVLSALAFGVDRITGIEINPAIFEALNEKFYDYTGRLTSYPSVRMANAEARSYINSTGNVFDLVQISLIDTWAATAAGGLTLSENKLYTREAWMEFLGRLDDDGMLAVSRWYVPGAHHGELYRMLALAVEALRSFKPDADIRNHLVVANSNHIVTLVVSKSPFTGEELNRFAGICGQYGFKPLLSSKHSFDSIADTIIAGNATRAFYDSLPLNYSPPTDDRPFFFNMARFGDVLFHESRDGPNLMNNSATYSLIFLLVATFVVMSYSVLWPFYKKYSEQKLCWSMCGPYVTYFICIGLGFMFIEMALMQRLSVFLGHPVYGLSVILFTMLLFSGIGSYTVKPTELGSQAFLRRPALLCLLLAGTGFAVAYAMPLLAHYNTAWRIVATIVMLAPISLFMGMMFPLGVGAASKDHAPLLPWLWALNGVASVFASITAVVVSMSYGINVAYVIGVCCYVLCALVSLRWRYPAVTSI